MKTICLFLLIVLISSCQEPEARRPIMTKTSSFIKTSIERNKVLNKKQMRYIDSIVTKDSITKYYKSNHGFLYYYDQKIEANLPKPHFGDLITFRYDVSDFSNNSIYTQQELGVQNYYMDQQELFTGLRQGLKLMKTGETVTFLFPSSLAYGYYGDEHKIGTNIPLLCKVTIDTIIKNEIK